jgi:bifunctional ADP-heptose synthase (sugar kinase/adenylyltransferase)
MDTRTKIISLEQAGRAAAELRAAGRRLILADGCFDVLQAAHARFLQNLRSDKAVLFVAVYDDASLCEIQGQARPILREQARAQLVAAVAGVDYVVICRQAEIEPLIARLQPDQVAHAAEERNIIGLIRNRHK